MIQSNTSIPSGQDAVRAESQSAFFQLKRKKSAGYRKTQAIIAFSSCEDENVATSIACKETTQLSRLHAVMLSLNISECVEFSNGKSETFAADKSRVISQQNKHVDLKYHFVPDCNLNKKARQHKLPTTEQREVIITKLLQGVMWEHFHLKLD